MKTCITPAITSIPPANTIGPLAHGHTRRPVALSLLIGSSSTGQSETIVSETPAVGIARSG